MRRSADHARQTPLRSGRCSGAQARGQAAVAQLLLLAASLCLDNDSLKSHANATQLTVKLAPVLLTSVFQHRLRALDRHQHNRVIGRG